MFPVSALPQENTELFNLRCNYAINDFFNWMVYPFMFFKLHPTVSTGGLTLITLLFATQPRCHSQIRSIFAIIETLLIGQLSRFQHYNLKHYILSPLQYSSLGKMVSQQHTDDCRFLSSLLSSDFKQFFYEPTTSS